MKEFDSMSFITSVMVNFGMVTRHYNITGIHFSIDKVDTEMGLVVIDVLKRSIKTVEIKQELESPCL